MIVVDTSAIVAILQQEDDASLYAEAIADADPPLISAATLVEVGIVMFNRHGPKAARMVDEFVEQAGFQVESVSARHAQLARDAYAAYGKAAKGAGLNYGDCFSYALAKATGLPLLFKGRDFLRTDLASVLE